MEHQMGAKLNPGALAPHRILLYVAEGSDLRLRGNLRLRALLVLLVMTSLLPALAQGTFRERLRQKFAQADKDASGSSSKMNIAGVDVAVWRPAQSGPSPLVIFSHGFHGRNTQSISLMKALAGAGYLVVAPNHRDAIGESAGFSRPEVGFGKVSGWSDKTYADREDDIKRVVEGLRRDPQWSSRVDWSKVALAGHSLGGYTVLGLAGAWPSWRLPGVKAVLALSPYVLPYMRSGSLAGLGIPVMYQGGTRDLGITPSLRRKGGAFSETASPAELVEFNGASHFAWSNFNRNPDLDKLINYYSVAFLDKFVKGDSSANPEAKLAGVSMLEVK
jgi:predicted dienelactone hydrolase